ncbi:hypothetical protein AAFF_G00150140 [Aldrovandia affinis]|uniref:Uncharacterized protein n=1 Tax=Aldrovandia affinis TaxID=143900 RepID=A0AAD7R2W6_9TELE|nr:hypothetical protein AAFF_G00150140 [Aldrovandia affinis]
MPSSVRCGGRINLPTGTITSPGLESGAIVDGWRDRGRAMVRQRRQGLVELDEDRLGSISTNLALEPGRNNVWCAIGWESADNSCPRPRVPPDDRSVFADNASPRCRHRLRLRRFSATPSMAEVWDLEGPTLRRVDFENEGEIDRLRLSITDDGPVVVALIDDRVPVTASAHMLPKAALRRSSMPAPGAPAGRGDHPHDDSISGSTSAATDPN